MRQGVHRDLIAKIYMYIYTYICIEKVVSFFLLIGRQPEQLTIVVEISNIVFSAVFAVEMLLKIIAEGPFGYISNGFNVFDGVVVVLRYANKIIIYAIRKNL